MKSIFRQFALALVVTTAITAINAQEVIYDVEFDSYFDNREYGSAEAMNERSGTDFAVRLMPEVGLRLAEGNTIVMGADLLKRFGADDSSFFSEVNPLIYYAYDSDWLSATAGLFKRSRMMVGDYSTAFFSQEALFDDPTVSGLVVRYMKGCSYVEFVVDWEGQPSTTSREKFRLLSSGRKWWGDRFYAGYNLSITHFAGQELEGFGNVVDNALVNPSVGVQLEGRYLFDAHVGYLQSLQRDRSYENEWLSPSMVEVGFRIERWGLSLDERIYIGDNLMPLYGGHTLEDGTFMEYGEQLYTGDIFFTTEGGYYNRASLSYERSFYDDKMSVRAAFVTHATKGGFGTEQILQLNINLGGRIYKKK